MREFFDDRDERRRGAPRALAQGPGRGRAAARSPRIYEADPRAARAPRATTARPSLRRSYERERALAGLTTAIACRVLFTTSNGTGPRAPDPVDGDRPPARRRGRAAVPDPLGGGAGGRGDGLSGRVRAPRTATPGSGNDYRWSRRLRARLRAAIAEADPDVIVFDGTHPYEALLGALRADSAAVWCRRPLWKRGSSRVPLGRAGAFDAVLEPGELAESEDARPDGRACATAPTGSARSSSSTARELLAARRGRGRARPRARAADVLVTLGQGPEVREATRALRCARSPAARTSRSRRSRSALAAADEVPEGVVALQRHLPDEPLLRRVRRRGRRRRLQRLPRADRARRAGAVRADAAATPTTSRPAPATPSAPGSGSGSTGPGRPGARGKARAAARPGASGARSPPPPRRPLGPARGAPAEAAGWLARRSPTPLRAGSIRRQAGRALGAGRGTSGRRWGHLLRQPAATPPCGSPASSSPSRGPGRWCSRSACPTTTSSTPVRAAIAEAGQGPRAHAGGHRRARGARRAAGARSRGRARAGPRIAAGRARRGHVRRVRARAARADPRRAPAAARTVVGARGGMPIPSVP